MTDAQTYGVLLIFSNIGTAVLSLFVKFLMDRKKNETDAVAMIFEGYKGLLEQRGATITEQGVIITQLNGRVEVLEVANEKSKGKVEVLESEVEHSKLEIEKSRTQEKVCQETLAKITSELKTLKERVEQKINPS